MMQLTLCLLAVLLLAATADQSHYQLTPPLPPTAFLAQTYSCQFRVPGLAYPAFRFQGLPSGLSGSASGLVRGVPSVMGSFLVSIRYSSNGYQASKQTVLRVALSGDSPANAQLIGSLLPRFAITSDHSFVCMVGVAVEIRLQAVMGTPPYIWAYLRLPSELVGGNGTISGMFELEGYYSFGVSCADSAGNSTEAYFTLNVQPLVFLTSYAPPTARPLADVPVRDAFPQQAWIQAGQAQQTAIACMEKAALAQSKARNELAVAGKRVNSTTTLLTTAKQQWQSAQQLVILKTDLQKAVVSILSNVTTNLAVKRQAFDQKQSILNLQSYKTKQATKAVGLMQQTIEQLQSLLLSVSNQFIDAQNNSTQAAFLVNAARMKQAEARDELQYSQSALAHAKQQYQSMAMTLDQAIQQLKLAQEYTEAAKSERDKASELFTSSSKTAYDALDELKKFNEGVAILRRDAADGRKAVGEAQYSLQMAINQLYVAQAMKEQADKAMLIVTTQESSPSLSTVFQGCQQSAYPSIFGSSVLLSVGEGSLMVSSGHQLLFGSCTVLPASMEAGDAVYFEGYLREGHGHLLLIEKQR